MSNQLLKRLAMGMGLSALLLAGCAEENNEPAEKEEPVQEEATETDEAASNNNMHLNLDSLGEIKEAEGIPVEDKEAIQAAFNQYIEAFNEENVDEYMDVISKTPVNFKWDEEKQFVQQIFEQVDSRRTVENVTIMNYQAKKADVYAEITAVTKNPETGEEATRSGKQMTIFHKNEDGWKVAALFFIADEVEE